MKESVIKSRCKKLLEENGWMVIHLITTNTAGIPDTMILKNGITIFIEFKRPGKKPEPLQEYRIQKLKQQGFKVFVIKSTEELNESITNGSI